MTIDDDELLFSRDDDGHLIRLDSATEEERKQLARLSIDGKEVIVEVVRPLTDAQGNPVQRLNGSTIFRYTTIYDAALQLFENESTVPISILCHQQHTQPVGVCRVCSVLVGGVPRKPPKDAADFPGKTLIELEAKLSPACHRHVKSGMHVFTANPPKKPEKPTAPVSAEKRKHYEDQLKESEKYATYLNSLHDVSRSRREIPDAVAKVAGTIKVLIELLVGDHLKAAPARPPAQELAPFNELKLLSDKYLAKKSRFAAESPFNLDGEMLPAPRRLPVDNSSPVFLVDHSACILCDRCSRACDEVKENNIIGRNGKGAGATIGFDLNDNMGESGCVQCSECMVSCPTSAITFKPVAEIKHKPNVRRHESSPVRFTVNRRPIPPVEDRDVRVLTAAEVMNSNVPWVHGLPPKFLLWQRGLIVHRYVNAGDELCRQGDPGNCAFFILDGVFRVEVKPKDGKGKTKLFFRAPEDIIVGEMACLSGAPRNATVTAAKDGEVLEVRRNVLDRIMRSVKNLALFEHIYAERALTEVLSNSDLFKELDESEAETCAKFLKDKLRFVRVGPRQTLFRQGDDATDGLYFVRLGHVRIAIQQEKDADVIFRGPGSVIGEMGLLDISREQIQHSTDGLNKTVENLDEKLANALNGPTLPETGRRMATCSSLDHLELARVSRASFLEMIGKYDTVRRKLIKMAVKRLADEGNDDGMSEFVRQGLYQAQNLLALDLDKCTRCDECTRACVDHHGTKSHGTNVTRLLREGLRFGNFLVTTSCRSCKDAYCMIGCPVDAIHRGKQQQIVIEDHCIGCGLCAKNCPYGNIWMLGNEHNKLPMPDPDSPGNTIAVVQEKAATCDLCDPAGTQEKSVPRCVHACPHDAAHRMTGEVLWKAATRTTTAKK